MKKTLLLVSLVLFSSIVFADVKLQINSGWSLVPAGIDNLIEQQCPQVGNLYSYSPTHKEFLLKVRKEGKLIEHDYARNGKHALSEYAQKTQDGYLIPDSLGAGKWAYSTGGSCLMTIPSLKPSRPDLKLHKGWNFVSMTESMVGQSTQDIFKNCVFGRAYTYSNSAQNWVDEMYYPTDSLDDTIKSKMMLENDVGTVYLVQVPDECRLAVSGQSGPPAVPGKVPEILKINPVAGPLDTTVVLSGKNFARGGAGNTIKIGGKEIKGVGAFDDTRTLIQARLPSTLGLQAGVYEVSVTNENGTSNAIKFEVTAKTAKKSGATPGERGAANTKPVLKTIPPLEIKSNSPDGTVILDNLKQYIEDKEDGYDKLILRYSNTEEIISCETSRATYKIVCGKPKMEGEALFNLYVEDSAGLITSQLIKIKVAPAAPEQTQQTENAAPTIRPFSNIELKVGTEEQRHLDFWNYVSDYKPASDTKDKLTLTLSGGTGTIPCYIESNRYLKCAKAVSASPSNLTLTVKDPGGLSATRNFTVTVAYNPQPPTITSVTPTLGKPFDMVTITGKDFTSYNNTVIIGGVEITGVQSYNYGTVLKIQLPNVQGEFDLKVSNTNGMTAPVIVKIEAPSTGSAATQTKFYKGDTIKDIDGANEFNGQRLSGTITDIYVDPQGFYHANIQLFDQSLKFIDYRGVAEGTEFISTFSNKDLDEPFVAVVKSNIKVSKIGKDESGKLYMEISRQ